MTKIEKIQVVLAVMVAAGSIASIVIDLRQHRREDAAMRLEAEKQLRAIWRSAGMITERIREGKYDEKPGQALNDFEFEIIAAREEDRS
jgi:hypothetical protein